LQQLAQDKDEIVRQAAARNLALLVTLFEVNDKYPQVNIVTSVFVTFSPSFIILIN
jgi:hypothetical protein